MSDDERRLVLIDASVFIALSQVGESKLLAYLSGQIAVPKQIKREITDEPASSILEDQIDSGRIEVVEVPSNLKTATKHLGKPVSEEELEGHLSATGDRALLALALSVEEGSEIADKVVVVSDDKPLRKTCMTLSIPVSGSIGVLIRAVEHGALEPEEAKEKLYALDDVGARLSASLIRRAEGLIDEAAEDS